MGRKKKKLMKPWCWYCNREFDEEKILLQHQKAKHFKCHICHKKLYTGPGLAIHCMQVHKETIDKVPNSLATRGNIEIEIYGMEGIPEEDMKEHERKKGVLCYDEDESEPSTSASTRVAADSLQIMPPGPPPGLMPPGIPPPPFVPGIPPWGAPPGMPPPLPPPAHMSNGARAIFPSTAAKPTFPAYSDLKPSLIVASSATSKIIHPSEDVSLEEKRSQLQKYNRSVSVSKSRPQAWNLHHSHQAPSIRPFPTAPPIGLIMSQPPLPMTSYPQSNVGTTRPPFSGQGSRSIPDGPPPPLATSHYGRL